MHGKPWKFDMHKHHMDGNIPINVFFFLKKKQFNMLNDSTEVGMKLECNMDIYMYISFR